MVSCKQPQQITLEAKITRADGSTKNLGCIAYWSANPLKQLWWRLTEYIKHRKPGIVRVIDKE